MLLVVLPVALLVWAWMTGALTMQQGGLQAAWRIARLDGADRCVRGLLVTGEHAGLRRPPSRLLGGLHRKLEKLREQQIDAIK